MLRNILALLIITSVVAAAQIQDSVTADLKIYSDTLSTKPDSILTSDSLLIVTERDSIVPLYSSPLTDKSYIASNKELLKLEYQYTGDYLRLSQFNFIKNLGFTGQPNETFLYGVGNDAVSYLMDGISYNDRQSNSLNLNLLQSEDVDSIEVIPLPRGFLYGAYNNPVGVNFITKDFLSAQPYTRIRFYQGTNRDMMFDGIFNAIITNKVIASFDITNRIADSTFKNTEYSIWQGKVKLKYLLSNTVNIIASYNYNDYKSGYSGGVDVDSINAIGGNVDEVLYNSLSKAPIFYPNGEVKTLTHLPRLRFLIKPTEWIKTDASLFFMFNRYEKNTSVSEFAENKTYGLNIRNDFDYSIFKFQLNVDYEKRDVFSSKSFYNPIDSIYSNILQNDFDADLFSVSGILSVNLNDGVFIPSIYYKTSSYKLNYSQPFAYNEDNSSQGIGIDLLVKIKSNFSFYVGTSALKPYNRSEFKYALIELGAKYQNEFVSADLKYFYNQYNYGLYTGGIFFEYIKFGDVDGLGLNLKFKYWKLLLESNSAYYSGAADNKLLVFQIFKHKQDCIIQANYLMIILI